MSSSQAKRVADQQSRRAERKLAAQRAARRRRIFLFLSPIVAIALVVVIVLIAVNSGGNNSGSPITVAAAVPANLKPEGRALGDPKAPVQVIEYGDYQCPGCEAFFSQVAPQFYKDYVETGKVYFQFHDYDFLARGATPDESNMAAQAAYCAQDQGKFWVFHDTLYDNQKPENSGGFSASRLKEMAKKIGLDTSKFNSCFDSGQHKNDVAAMKTAGANAGLTSTPSFVVDGKLITYTGYSSLKAAIDAAIAAKK